MTLEQQILAAVVLDLSWATTMAAASGRGIAWLAARLVVFAAPRPVRRVACGGAGYVVVGAAAGSSLAASASPAPADAASIVLIQHRCRTCAAQHGRFRPLAAGNLLRPVAAQLHRPTRHGGPGRIGRVRATVESVAESTSTASLRRSSTPCSPGRPGIVYRAINTSDSMFGHRDERYARLAGRPPVATTWSIHPARLTAPLLCLAAACPPATASGRPRLLRDGRKHASPNAGLAEAAVAGALGVQFGGTTSLRRPAAPRPDHRRRPDAAWSAPHPPGQCDHVDRRRLALGPWAAAAAGGQRALALVEGRRMNQALSQVGDRGHRKRRRQDIARIRAGPRRGCARVCGCKHSRSALTFSTLPTWPGRRAGPATTSTPG